jgi:hypothetical protein
MCHNQRPARTSTDMMCGEETPGARAPGNCRSFDGYGECHTHHITLVDADVVPIANGFQVTGIATFTFNGGRAPAAVSPSMVVTNITGGAEGRIFQSISPRCRVPCSRNIKLLWQPRFRSHSKLDLEGRLQLLQLWRRNTDSPERTLCRVLLSVGWNTDRTARVSVMWILLADARLQTSCSAWCQLWRL